MSSSSLTRSFQADRDPRERGFRPVDSDRYAGSRLDGFMPVICRFLGIVIVMYYNDHEPPHFHAKYGEFEITVEVETGVINGNFPPRALRHVLDWYDIRTDELRLNWELARRREPLQMIAPLE